MPDESDEPYPEEDPFRNDTVAWTPEDGDVSPAHEEEPDEESEEDGSDFLDLLTYEDLDIDLEATPPHKPDTIPTYTQDLYDEDNLDNLKYDFPDEDFSDERKEEIQNFLEQMDEQPTYRADLLAYDEDQILIGEEE